MDRIESQKVNVALDLPPEIVAYICVLHSASSTQDPDSPPPPPHTPLSLSHICSTWRQSVISDPRLWCSISITPPWNFNTIQLYLERSQTLPLTLDFSQIAHISEARRSDAVILFNLLQSHWTRCKSIRLHGRFGHNVGFVDKLMEEIVDKDMPLLQQLWVFGATSDDAQMDFPAAPNIFLSAPMLSDVRLGAAGFGRYRPPLSNVTNLEVGKSRTSSSFGYLMDLVQHCPKLESISMYGNVFLDQFLGPDGWHDPLAILPSVQTLRIFEDIQLGLSLFSLIHLPNLRTFLFAPAAGNDIPRWSPDATPLTLDIGFSSVETLFLSPVRPESFMKVVPNAAGWFRHVKTLVLVTVYPDELLQVFTEEEVNGGVIFPDLEHLVLNCVDELFLKPIRSLLDYRVEKGRVVKRLSVDSVSARYIGKEAMADLATSTSTVIDVCDLWEGVRANSMFGDDLYKFLGVPLCEVYQS